MSTPTISSLAFRIFRTKYLTDEMQIPILNGPIYEDIKKGYTGGAVDVYKPYGENITVYDVKSLYPSVMLQNAVPTGIPKYFEGNIMNILNLLSSNDYDKPFGFFYCKITSPNKMYAPILQTKQKINNLTKSIAPLGTWKGWYFSEELYNAKKYGYEYTVEKGYLFDKKYLFNDYVTTLYKIKEENKKGSPLSLIAKLLLNSLYGRFGMSPDDENHILTSQESAEYFELDDNYKILDIIDFKNGKELISYKKTDDINIFKNISIGIASAITSYGRIHMSQFKNDSSLGDLLYSDTDCIAISGKLPDKYLGKKLGKMEIEKSYKKVIYIAPKVYIGLNNDDQLKAKIKGVKNVNKYKDISKKIPGFTFDNILKLLTRNKDDSKFRIDQQKWTRQIKQGTIKVSEDTYTLMVTGNKRNLVYENDVYVNTEPLIIEKDLENTDNLENTTD